MPDAARRPRPLQLDEERDIDRGTTPRHSTLHSVTIKTLCHGRRRQAINLEKPETEPHTQPGSRTALGYLDRASLVEWNEVGGVPVGRVAGEEPLGNPLPEYEQRRCV